MTEQTLDRPLKNDSPSDEISNSGASALTNDTPVTQDAARAPLAGAWGEVSDGEDFDYVPVSPWAPIALCLGLLGLTGFIGIFGLYVAFFGIFIGIAAVGLVLSVASFALGSAKMAHAYSTEVPDGFKRVNFPKDIAEKGFVTVYGHRKLEPSVATLIGQKVYLKGFMWATQDTEGLTRFILLKDNGECCFGGKPKSHDYIFVTLASFNDGERPPLSFRAGGLSVKELNDEEKAKLKVPKDLQLTTLAYLGMVAAAGVLEADVKAGEKGPAEDFEYAPVYSMEAELVEEAWTRF